MLIYQVQKNPSQFNNIFDMSKKVQQLYEALQLSLTIQASKATKMLEQLQADPGIISLNEEYGQNLLMILRDCDNNQLCLATLIRLHSHIKSTHIHYPHLLTLLVEKVSNSTVKLCQEITKITLFRECEGQKFREILSLLPYKLNQENMEQYGCYMQLLCSVVHVMNNFQGKAQIRSLLVELLDKLHDMVVLDISMLQKYYVLQVVSEVKFDQPIRSSLPLWVGIFLKASQIDDFGLTANEVLVDDNKLLKYSHKWYFYEWKKLIVRFWSSVFELVAAGHFQLSNQTFLHVIATIVHQLSLPNTSSTACLLLEFLLFVRKQFPSALHPHHEHIIKHLFPFMWVHAQEEQAATDDPVGYIEQTYYGGEYYPMVSRLSQKLWLEIAAYPRLTMDNGKTFSQRILSEVTRLCCQPSSKQALLGLLLLKRLRRKLMTYRQEYSRDVEMILTVCVLPRLTGSQFMVGTAIQVLATYSSSFMDTKLSTTHQSHLHSLFTIERLTYSQYIGYCNLQKLSFHPFIHKAIGSNIRAVLQIWLSLIQVYKRDVLVTHFVTFFSVFEQELSAHLVAVFARLVQCVRQGMTQHLYAFSEVFVKVIEKGRESEEWGSTRPAMKELFLLLKQQSTKQAIHILRVYLHSLPSLLPEDWFYFSSLIQLFITEDSQQYTVLDWDCMELTHTLRHFTTKPGNQELLNNELLYSQLIAFITHTVKNCEQTEDLIGCMLMMIYICEAFHQHIPTQVQTMMMEVVMYVLDQDDEEMFAEQTKSYALQLMALLLWEDGHFVRRKVGSEEKLCCYIEELASVPFLEEAINKKRVILGLATALTLPLPQQLSYECLNQLINYYQMLSCCQQKQNQYQAHKKMFTQANTPLYDDSSDSSRSYTEDDDICRDYEDYYRYFTSPQFEKVSILSYCVKVLELISDGQLHAQLQYFINLSGRISI